MVEGGANGHARKAAEKRFFKDRELILRSEGKVVFFRLGIGFQKGLCIFGGVILAWAAVASASTWWQLRLNEDKTAEIVEAKLSYDLLRGDLEAYQTQIATLAAEIAERQKKAVGEEEAALAGAMAETPYEIDLAALAQISSGIETAFDRIARDLDVSEADRDRIVQSRDSLHQKIGELEGTLEDERGTVSRLNEDIVRLEEVLENRGRAVTDLEETRSNLTDQIVNLSDSLRQAERRGEALVREGKELSERIAALDETNEAHEEARHELSLEITNLNARLSIEQARSLDAREGIEGLISEVANVLQESAETNSDEVLVASEVPPREFVDRLGDKLSRMLSRYEDATTYARRADGALGHAMASLERVTGRLPEAVLSSESDADEIDTAEQRIAVDAPTKVRTLVNEVERLHDAQLGLVERLTAQVEADVSAAEGLLQMAGVDIDAIVEGLDVSGSGGPEADIGFDGGSSEALSSGVASLQSLVARRRMLAETLRCMPLIAPVDYYHVTSPYGKRKDPISGRWSRHKGIDLGAWPGTKVLATGAGKVVAAGTNKGYGKMVRIDHGCGIQTVYAHLKRITVKRGQEVTHRQVIGTLGSTGRSTGPHVHYEVLMNGVPIDPAKVMEAGRYVFKT